MKVFMPTYGASHINIVLPIVKVMEESNDTAVILGLTAAVSVLKQSGFKYKTLEDYFFLFEKEESAILELGMKLAKDNHNSESGIDYRQTVLYHGISMYFLIKEKGEKEAWRLFNEKKRAAFLPTEAMDRIIKFEKPDVVVASTYERMELASVLSAKKNGVPSAYILNRQYVQNLSSCLLDNVLVLNKPMFEECVKLGFDKNKLFITGQPAFDSLFAIDISKARLDVDHEFQLNKNKKIILWLSQIADQRIFDEFLNIAKRRPDWQIVVKLHPTFQELSDFKLTETDWELTNFKLIKHYDTQKLIAASDVAVMANSTSGHEAIILNKPLIVVNATDYGLFRYDLGYAKNESALLLENESDLERYIDDSMNDTYTREKMFKGRGYYAVKKNAAKNVVEVLKKLSREKASSKF